MKKLYIICILLLYTLTFSSAFSNEFQIICGGDEEFKILCSPLESLTGSGNITIVTPEEPSGGGGGGYIKQEENITETIEEENIIDKLIEELNQTKIDLENKIEEQAKNIGISKGQLILYGIGFIWVVIIIVLIIISLVKKRKKNK